MSGHRACGPPPRAAATAVRSTHFRHACFAALVVASLVMLFTPASGTPPLLLPGLDKVVHLVLFAALGLSGRWAGLRPVALGVGLLAYAGASEVLQGVLPLGRSADPVDALVDVAGIALGFLVARRLVDA